MVQRIPWLRVFVEGAVIVLSILLAFGIDAWWDGVGEASRRKALLEGLQADFDLAATQFEVQNAIGQTVVEATERWLELSRSAEASPSLVPLADTLLSEMLYVTLFEPPLGAVEALINGGDMSVLEDPQLARDLTTWMALLNTYQEREEYAVAVYHDQLMPYLIESGVAVADLTWVSDTTFAPDYPLTPRHTDGYRLLPDQRFQGIVANVWYARNDIRAREGPLREALETIRGRLADR
jgi:hypothetical protein